jgi:uncharacterized protein YndB with AHSA1/START domain
MQNRQITLTRLIAAPPETVWRCWTDPAILPQWFGPEGYCCTTKEIDLREGGLWRFDMIGPDGTVWANRHRFTLHQSPHRIEFLMDADSDDDPPYEVVVTLAPEQGGTRLTQTMTFPTQDARDGALAYGADRLGQTTLAKLEAQAILLLPRSSS